MGTDLKTIFDIGEELSNQKKQITEKENISEENKKECEHTKVTFEKLENIFDGISKERAKAKYTGEPIKDINKNKKDLEYLKIMKKEVTKIGKIAVAATGIITIGMMTLYETLLSIDDPSILEETLSNLMLMAGGTYIGASLFPLIKIFSEAKEIEEEIYKENPELKKNKKPRRIGTK